MDNKDDTSAGLPRRPAILLVDDTEANLVALEAILCSLSCDLVLARSGNEALSHLLKRKFAVVLLDVQMPEMDGFEVARYARENPDTREVPIIFVTAMHETPDSVLQGYASGAFDFLFKPVNPFVLRSKVQTFLDLYVSRTKLVDEIAAHRATLGELEAFNYSVSHDLRAPLRPLAGFSEVLLEDYKEKLDERGTDYLKRIRAAAQKMGHLIDDMLELSHVSCLELRRQPVDLSRIVNEIITDLRVNQPERQVELICAPGIKVEGDPRLLRIALDNLIRNAWKFTQKKASARIEFARTAINEGSYFVRDDGAGFDPAFADKLFQPFQRLHKNSEFEGTGIGLAIVARIIRRHGGRLWAEATPGLGATIYFTVPDREDTNGRGAP